MNEDDARDELRAIVRSTRALVEAYRDAGATGFPRRPREARAAAPPMEVPERMEAPDASMVEPPADRIAPPAARIALPVPETLRPSAPKIEIDRSALRARLPMLAEEIKGCTKCALAPTRKNTVFARGNPEAELVFVGEGPGENEDREGFPFVGKAGQLLDRMIVAMGYARDDVYVCNVVKCRPPANRKPSSAEMTTCAPYLHEQLAAIAPKVIVALGGTAVEGMLELPDVKITRMRGQWKLYRGLTPVMPTFHPSYVLRDEDGSRGAKRQVWDDLQAVMEKLGRGKKRA